MRWEKLGLVYRHEGKSTWAKHSALQPTPMLLDEDTIRVFVGFRDNLGVGRVGYVDVSADDPRTIIRVSKHPLVDIGKPGAFDENGVVPCAVVRVRHSVHLYYAGYQLGQQVRFMAFSGLAVSDDGGHSFRKLQPTPVLERSEEAFLFRVIHSILFENNTWRVWYGAGSEFRKMKDKSVPIYNVRYLESPDCFRFPSTGAVVLDCNRDESRVGRPFIFKDDRKYRMFFAYETTNRPFRLGYAESENGINWKRRTADLGLRASKVGWDSKMVSYPAVITTRNSTYLFYNGNDYGREGFGCAILRKWS